MSLQQLNSESDDLLEKFEKVAPDLIMATEEGVELLEAIPEPNSRDDNPGRFVVTCGSCGEVLRGSTEFQESDCECPLCGYVSEPCDFPDYQYETEEDEEDEEG